MILGARFTPLVLVALLSVGCTTKPPELPVSLPPLPTPAAWQPAGPAPAALTPTLNLNSAVPWLYVDDFFPAGAHAFLPLHGYAPKLVETPRAWFPSVVDCVSPDRQEVLFHEAYRGEGLNHLIFVRMPPSDARVPLLATRDTAEFLWSPDSRRVAVSMLTGNNSSSVYIVELKGHKLSGPIDAEDEVSKRLGRELAQTPHFVMALRWTESGELVVRARGRRLKKPHTIFGYECLIDVARLGHPDAVRFLRGFIKQPVVGEE